MEQRESWRSLAERRKSVVGLLLKKGYERRERAFRLSSGKLSHDYIDGKRAIAHGEDLILVSEAILSLTHERKAEFKAVGGLTMGADALAHAISVLTNCEWFSVRKEPKEHGTQRSLEGAPLERGLEVLLVDDVVTTGKSIITAVEAIQETGANVQLAVSVCDRGTAARGLLAKRGIPYEPLVTYEDLGLEPVG